MNQEIQQYQSDTIAITPQQVVSIRDRIFIIRNIPVMLDRDLAALYGVEVKYLNRQVKRNIERFPSDFMFQLTKEDCLRCQIGTLNKGRGQHFKYLPFAFTEIGVAMLSGVLNSQVAIQANRKIMRAFVAYRHLAEIPIAATYLELKKEIEAVRSEVNDILADQNDINESTRAQLDAISTALAELQAKPAEDKTRRPIGFIQPKDEDEE